MTQGGYQVIIILPIKAKWLLLGSGAFCDFCILLNLPSVIQSPRFTNDYEFFISVSIQISSRHSNLNIAHHFVIY